MFVDRAIITVKAGDGGPGCVAFRRQKYEPKGGPNGGNGGHGGDVVLYADEGCNTLLDFRGNPNWEAQGGGPGGGKPCTGKDGNDLVIKMPPGTLVYRKGTSELIVDLQPRQTFVVAKGGTGGFGNEHYKSASNQTPLHAHPGFPGDRLELQLDLKLIADVGLVGMPNAGKSTLLKALTKATPKIADYPFTTLSPQLGVAELPRDGKTQKEGQRRIVLADLPGLIEGASKGAGLGHDFLRHIERTRILLHLLDVVPTDGSNPAKNYKMIRKELQQYSMELAEREEIICLNKMDLLEDDAARDAAMKKLRKDLKLGADVEVFALSGATRTGTRELLEHLWRVLKRKPKSWEAEAPGPTKSQAVKPASKLIGIGGKVTGKKSITDAKAGGKAGTSRVVAKKKKASKDEPIKIVRRTRSAASK